VRGIAGEQNPAAPIVGDLPGCVAEPAAPPQPPQLGLRMSVLMCDTDRGTVVETAANSTSALTAASVPSRPGHAGQLPNRAVRAVACHEIAGPQHARTTGARHMERSVTASSSPRIANTSDVRGLTPPPRD
jgi:hypothetical protein